MEESPTKSKAQRPTENTKEQERPKENIKEIKAQIYAWAQKEMQGK